MAKELNDMKNNCRGYYQSPNKNKDNKNNCRGEQCSSAGITLISLVVTIIILLILAGITLKFAFGENGIINKAKLAVDKYKQSQKNEIEMLSELNMNITLDNINSEPNSAVLSELEGLRQELNNLQNQVNNMKINSSNVIADRDSWRTFETMDTASGTATTGYTGVHIRPIIYFDNIKIYDIQVSMRFTGQGVYSVTKSIPKDVFTFKAPLLYMSDGVALVHDSTSYRDGYISNGATINDNILRIDGYSNCSSVTQYVVRGFIIDYMENN